MATKYISPSGSDTTGDGSSGNPWATLAKAYTASASGDTIVCKDGTYTFAAQSFSKTLTVAAEHSGLVIFDGGGANVNWSLGAITLTLDGVIIQNISGSGIFSISATGSILVANDGIIRSNTISPSGFNGIVRAGYNFVANVTFSGCLLYSNAASADGATLFGIPLGTGTINLVNCVYYDNTTGVSHIDTIAESFNGTLTLTNTIVMAAGDSFSLSGSDEANNCCFYNCTSAPAGANNITSDPLFINAASGDFHLAQSSPCRGTGTQP